MSERSSSQKKSDKKYDAKRAGLRSRNWATVVYPESAPDGWMNYLAESGFEVLISPLHDRDEENGQPKKPHYHVLVMGTSPMTCERFIELVTEPIGGVGQLQVHSARGQARYLCHLDSPDKAQYNPQEVLAFGGADYSALIHTGADRIKTVKAMQAWCRDHRCIYISQLMDYAAEYEPDWYDSLVNNSAYIMVTYLKSLGAELSLAE